MTYVMWPALMATAAAPGCVTGTFLCELCAQSWPASCISKQLNVLDEQIASRGKFATNCGKFKELSAVNRYKSHDKRLWVKNHERPKWLITLFMVFNFGSIRFDGNVSVFPWLYLLQKRRTSCNTVK